MIIRTEKLHGAVRLPVRATVGSAGYDLRAVGSYIVPANGRLLIETGLAIEIPEGNVGLVCSRSGLAIKHGVFVLNAPGIIDSDYRGNIKVILANSTNIEYFVADGDRIAQLLVVRHESPTFVCVDSVNEATERGAAGFGSTGAA